MHPVHGCQMCCLLACHVQVYHSNQLLHKHAASSTLCCLCCLDDLLLAWDKGCNGLIPLPCQATAALVQPSEASGRPFHWPKQRQGETI
jgi:hypothetical protein